MCDTVVGQYVDIQYIVYTGIILICLPNIHIDMSYIIKLGLSNSTNGKYDGKFRCIATLKQHMDKQ